MTNVNLELLTDYDMHLFIEKGMRGGISTVEEKRYAKANNPLVRGYDKTKKPTYIMYEDENNEYGWAMKQLMPIGNFRWRKPDEDLEVSKKKIIGWKSDLEEGFILEVDLEVPRVLHDHFRGYPLAPER